MEIKDFIGKSVVISEIESEKNYFEDSYWEYNENQNLEFKGKELTQVNFIVADGIGGKVNNQYFTNACPDDVEPQELTSYTAIILLDSNNKIVDFEVYSEEGGACSGPGPAVESIACLPKVVEQDFIRRLEKIVDMGDKQITIDVELKSHQSSREHILKFDVKEEINKFFNEASIPAKGEPEFVLITGGVGAGKTTLRKSSFSKGYVVLDANEIFMNLCKGVNSRFEDFKEMVEILGSLIADKAVKEKRNIVMEVIGDSFENTESIIDAIISVGYKIKLNSVDCDQAEAYKRHLKAVKDDKLYISCYFTQDLHRRWILEAVKKNQNSAK